MHTLNFDVKEQNILWTNPCRQPVEKTKGIVYAQFSVDHEWEGLTVYVMFDNPAAGKPKRVLWKGEPIQVPPEMLTRGQLKVGLVGIADGGQMRNITHSMENGIPVSGGTDVEGEDPDELAPALWEQVLAAIGDLPSLSTENKTSLVSAINELLSLFGENGTDGRAIELALVDGTISWRYAGDQAWNALVALTALKGDKGDPGEPGVSANDDEMSDLWAALAAMRSGTNYPILDSGWQANARDASGYSTMANWRKTVKYVSFVKDYTPSGSEITWTVSAEDSPSTITGYQLGDHVYICANGCEKIRLVGHINPFMSSLPNLIEVNGLDMLDGLESTKTAGWFSGCTSIKHIDLSMIKVPNVFNTQGMFAGCASLETVKLPLGLEKVLVDFAVERNAMYGMFNNCPNLREIDLGRGLTNVNNEMFHKMYNLERIKGLGSVTTIGDKAFCYTPKVKTDLKPERITSIGASAFRMSGVETYTDFSSVPVDAVGEKATRHVRWSADELKAIQAISVPDVYKAVPNAISQKNIDIVYSTEEDGTTHTVSECGCMSVACYHVWQALHAGTDKEYPNYESWFSDKLNYDGQWATKNYMTGNGNMPASTNMLLDSLGWTNPNISESNTLGKISAQSAEQKQIIVDRLNAGLPTVVSIHSVNIDGNHAVAIIGSDSVTDKFAVIDSAVSDTVAVVSWLAYEDIFVFNDSPTKHDGIYPIEYGAES